MSAGTHARQDRIARRVLRAVGALPLSAQRLLAGRPTRIDGQQLHPEVNWPCTCSTWPADRPARRCATSPATGGAARSRPGSTAPMG